MIADIASCAAVVALIVCGPNVYDTWARNGFPLRRR